MGKKKARPPIVAERRESRLDDRTFLVGLGAQKAGSTWLARYLREHPDAYVSRLKELHYFDAVYRPLDAQIVKNRMVRFLKEMSLKACPDGKTLHAKQYEKLVDVIDRLQMTSDRKYPYLRYFEDRVKDEKVFCDITPGYSMLDANGFEAILKTHPRVKFVFILRNPIDRFWSALRMAARKMSHFDPQDRFMGALRDWEHVGRTDYRRTIEELEKVASRSQIKYLFYERLFEQGTMDDLTGFLGLSPRPAKFDEIVNPGMRIDLKPEHLAAAREKFRPVYEFVIERFGDDTPAKWLQSFHGTEGARPVKLVA